MEKSNSFDPSRFPNGDGLDGAYWHVKQPLYLRSCDRNARVIHALSVTHTMPPPKNTSFRRAESCAPRSGQRERVMESRGNASGAGLADDASHQSHKSGRVMDSTAFFVSAWLKLRLAFSHSPQGAILGTANLQTQSGSDLGSQATKCKCQKSLHTRFAF
jgi:hypothetical protein